VGVGVGVGVKLCVIRVCWWVGPSSTCAHALMPVVYMCVFTCAYALMPVVCMCVCICAGGLGPSSTCAYALMPVVYMCVFTCSYALMPVVCMCVCTMPGLAISAELQPDGMCAAWGAYKYGVRYLDTFVCAS
jgi:hypothetical protein